MTIAPDPELSVPRHLTDEDLLAWLDGELPADAQAETAVHLERFASFHDAETISGVVYQPHLRHSYLIVYSWFFYDRFKKK